MIQRGCYVAKRGSRQPSITLTTSAIKSVNYNHGFIGDQVLAGYVRLVRTKDALKLFDELHE